MSESTTQFASRKKDHIDQALSEKNQAAGDAGFGQIKLLHEALPDTNFSDISLETESLETSLRAPFLVSSMTAGHVDSTNLNMRLAKACEKQGWLFGVGSQRRELNDPSAAEEWKALRAELPNLSILGNIGITQLAEVSTSQMEELVNGLQAKAMIVHLNPLQEVIQPEGTPQFRGAFEALQRLSNELSVPVVVKETGCGFSQKTLKRLNDLKLAAVDVAGFGGTHWGLIEGSRAGEGSLRHEASLSFQSWGISTVDSLKNAARADMACEVWASGGMRTGLDAAKAIALGARVVGFAKPILEAALKGEDELQQTMQRLEFELKAAVFCAGLKNVSELHNNQEVLLWPNH